MSLELILVEIKQKVANASPIGKTLKFDFGDQQLFVDGTSASNQITMENRDADCLVLVSMDIFISLVRGELNPMDAVMTGKVKIKGDATVAMKLNSFFG